MVYRSKKTGDMYVFVDNAIDESRNGLEVVIYRAQNGQLYVREKVEFEQKFERTVLGI
jgi:hypothetical protein